MKTCPKCGNEHGRKHPYCLPCHRAAQKADRARTSMTPAQRRKDSARSYANVYKRRGNLAQEPCRKCGNPESQMHHHDYGRPLDVEWLCRACHMEWQKFWLARVKYVFAAWVLIDDQKVTPIVKHETA